MSSRWKIIFPHVPKIMPYFSLDYSFDNLDYNFLYLALSSISTNHFCSFLLLKRWISKDNSFQQPYILNGNGDNIGGVVERLGLINAISLYSNVWLVICYHL